MYYCKYEDEYGDGLYLNFGKKRYQDEDFDGEMKITWTYLPIENLWETNSRIDGVDTKECLLDYLNNNANLKGTGLKISKIFN
jgi:hypothetical protein